MILVDTSVWVDHLNRGNTELARLLSDGLVTCHEAIIGELACGQLQHRKEVLRLLASLPKAENPESEELLRLLDHYRLFGRGLSWIDVQLLGAAIGTRLPLWTKDKALMSAAQALHVAYEPGS